jgi:hypothetical protein
MDRKDLFELLYWEERVPRLEGELEKLQTVLTQERARRDAIKSDLTARYTENGKYKLIGQIDRETAQGQRVLVDSLPQPESVPDPAPDDEEEVLEEEVLEEDDYDDEEDEGADVISLSKKARAAELASELAQLNDELDD